MDPIKKGMSDPLFNPSPAPVPVMETAVPVEVDGIGATPVLPTIDTPMAVKGTDANDANLPDMEPQAQPNKFSGLTPASPITAAELQDYTQNEETISFLKAMGLATQSEWAIMWAGGGGAPDANFVMTPELYEELTNGVPEEYWEYFDQAYSEKHARALKEKMTKDLQVEQQLAKMGGTGIGIRIAAAMLDPVALGLTYTSELTAAPWVYALKAGRVTRALRGGAVAAASNAGVESLLVSQKPTAEASNILFAGLTGLTLGSIAGAIGRGVNVAQNEAIAASLARAQRAIEAGEIGPMDSVGAMRAVVVQEPISDAAEQTLRQAAEDAPTTAFSGPLRFDSVGQLKSSPNPMARSAGSRLGEDAVGNVDFSVNIFGATEIADDLYRRMDTIYHREVSSAYRRWADERGLNWLERQKQRKAFMENVGKFIRNPEIEVQMQVREAAQAIQKQYEELLMKAKEAGVRGFENVEPNARYLNRVYDSAKLGGMISRFGVPQMQRMIKEAIKRMQPELSDDILERLAKWHLKKIRSHAVGADFTAMRAVSGEDWDALKNILVEEGDFSAEEVDDLIKLFKKPRDGAHPRAKHRLLLDENFSMPMRDAAGNVEEIGIQDILVNDVDVLFGLYNRQISGAIALAKAGFKSRGDFDTYIKHMKMTADEVPGLTMSQLQKDIENLEFLYNAVAGRPTNVTRSGVDLQQTKWGKISRMVRDYNFIRVMGQVGWAQLAELFMLVGEAGVRTAMKSIPAFGAMIRNARTGKLSDEFMDELEYIFGFGAERNRGIVANRWDDFGNYINTNEGGVFNKAETLLHYGKRITSDVSGMSLVNTVLHRWVVQGFAQKFADMATGLSKANMGRLRANGVSEEMLDRISAQIRKHSTMEDGTFTRNKLRSLNYDSWDDIEAAEIFRLAIHRMARKAVQENDAGNMHRWMSHPLMQIITQFRTFMLVAYSKQTLRGLYHHDFETFASWALSMIAAGSAYTAQTYIKSLGREDAQEYRDKWLSPEAIGFAAFARSGWSSLFPPVLTSLGGILSDDPFFHQPQFRTTGLSTGVLGNPTFDLLDKLYQSGVSTGRLMTDEDYRLSQSNLRNYFGVLPWQNVMGIQNILNSLGADLPRHSGG